MKTRTGKTRWENRQISLEAIFVPPLFDKDGGR
jgi:hypothetical protein